MRAIFNLVAAGATAAAFIAAVSLPATAACKRYGFTVNDYGKDGPTKDAKALLDKPYEAAVLAGIVLAMARSPEPASAVPEARLRLLADLSIFAGAPPFAIEGLASACREVRVPAGAVVIRAGDPADALFVIVGGSAVVTAASGAVLATLGVGDYFGEIGIVKGVPRTATVTAATGSTLVRIEAEDFLALIRDGAVARGVLGRGVGVRLARGATTT